MHQQKSAYLASVLNMNKVVATRPHSLFLFALHTQILRRICYQLGHVPNEDHNPYPLLEQYPSNLPTLSGAFFQQPAVGQFKQP